MGVASADFGAVLMLATAAGPRGTCEENWCERVWPIWVVVMVLPRIMDAIGDAIEVTMVPAFGDDNPVADGVTICRNVDSCGTEDPPTDFTVYDGVTEAAITFPPVEDTEMAGCKTGLGDAGSLCPSVVNADLAVSR